MKSRRGGALVLALLLAFIRNNVVRCLVIPGAFSLLASPTVTALPSRWANKHSAASAYPQRKVDHATFSLGVVRSIEANNDKDTVTASDNKDNDSSSSVAAATFSLVKAMVGSGVLALPAGVAAISNHRGVLWPANTLLIVLGILSAYTFHLYGRLTHHAMLMNDNQEVSLGSLWQTIQGSDSALINVANFLYCFVCALTFQLVIGDALSSLVKGVGGNTVGSYIWLSQRLRQTSILAVTAALLVPLCRLNSLAALAPVSVVGVLGSLVTTAFLGYRCPAVMSTSPYATAGRGNFANMAAARQPSFDTYHGGITTTPAPLVLLAMGCVALMAHFSAPDFYQSFYKSNSVATVAAAAPPASTFAWGGHHNGNDPQGNAAATMALRKFTKMTALAYTSVMLINGLCMSFGFLTFGGASAGIILNNYAATDLGASLSRGLVAVSVIGGFPFVFQSAQSSLLELMYNGSNNSQEGPSPRTRRLVRWSLLGLVTAIALLVQDAGFVVSFNGALMGTSIIYTFPALLYLKQTSSMARRPPRTRAVQLERWFCRFLVLFGVVSAGVGGATSVINSFYPHLLHPK